MTFIDEHKVRFGVEPICRVLTQHGIKIAPSTYYDTRRRKCCPQAVRDDALKSDIVRLHKENFDVYGARKMWLTMNSEGIEVARCTVERLMKDLGLKGARRGKKVRTTVPDETADRPKDLLKRRFNTLAPNVAWVADFTYVSTWAGMIYVALVIDTYSRRILGWKAARRMKKALVLDALEMAIWTRAQAGITDLTGLIHHNDAGSQSGFN